MDLSGLRKVQNPYVMMLISVSISVTAYIIAAYLSGYTILVFWILFTAVISGSIAFIATNYVAKMMAGIEQQNEELERLNLLNQELFSTISHDIRSPLTGITLLLELVRTDSLNQKDADNLFNELSLNIEHLISFLDELLVWSKRQIDKKPLKPELIETKPIIESTVLLYSRIITMKELNLKLDSISGYMLVDKGSYSFIIRNVLQNAIKFTPKGGTIEINVEQIDGNVKTVIKDNGIGMSDEKIDDILSLRSYASTVGTEDEFGVGFGLRASLSYLKRQKGSMEIVSGEDAGSTVTIIIPKH